jgi:hypothetical protein
MLYNSAGVKKQETPDPVRDFNWRPATLNF